MIGGTTVKDRYSATLAAYRTSTNGAKSRKVKKMRLTEVEAKSIIVPSKLPDADYVVNPYTGCEFGCVYCYASFMGKYIGEDISEWGNYVSVKTNAVDLFKKDFPKIIAKGGHPTLLMSSVTDAYQGVEKKYELARGILEVVASSEFEGRFEVLTKSPLVLRDLDHLSSIKNATVGMTITTTSDKISRFLELRAPHATRRLNTLSRLHDAGVNTYAFVGPLLPHFKFAHDELNDLFAAIADTGVQTVFVEHINMKKYIQERLNPQIAKTSSEIQDLYNGAKHKEHREELQAIIPELLEKHGLRLRLNEVLYHDSK